MLARVVTQAYGYLIPSLRPVVAGPIDAKDVADQWDGSNGIYKRIAKNVSKLAVRMTVAHDPRS
jgi:hypothetical protein